MAQRFLNGIDYLSQVHDTLERDRLALFTAPSSLNRDYESPESLLHGDYKLSLLFVGDGGIRGASLPGQSVPDGVDLLTDLPFVSLFQFPNRPLDDAWANHFDRLVIDVQEIGSRNDSVVQHVATLLQYCAAHDKPVMVFDRPNPLSGAVVETIPVSEDLRQVVPHLDIPLRHGLTVGELAKVLAKDLEGPLTLDVVPFKDWQRDMVYPDLGRAWIPPSLTLPHFVSALLYPGMALMAGTNVSYGMGTSLPYEVIGAPYLDALQFSSRLNSMSMSGVRFRPIYFKPTAGRYVGRHCQGVQIHVVDPYAIRPVELTLRIIDTLKSEALGDFGFLAPEEMGTTRHLIDRLSGNAWIRDPNLNMRDLIEEGRKAAAKFQEMSAEYYIYQDAPEEILER